MSSPSASPPSQGLARRFLQSRSSPSLANLRGSAAKSSYAAYRRDALQDKIRQRDQLLEEKVEALVRVWKRAGTPDSEQDLFLAAGTDLPHAARVARVNTALQSALSSLLTAQRTKILDLWKTLKVGEQERASMFPAFHDKQENVTEEMLLQHDNIVNTLQQRLSDSDSLLHKIDSYQDLLKERDSLAAATTDPSRLLDRNTNSYRWRKAEDRLHALVHKLLPERKRCLLREVCDWEQQASRHYLVWDERYLDYLTQGFDKVALDPRTLDPHFLLELRAVGAAFDFDAPGVGIDGSGFIIPPSKAALEMLEAERETAARPVPPKQAREGLAAGDKKGQAGSVVRIQYKAGRPCGDGDADVDGSNALATSLGGGGGGGGGAGGNANGGLCAAGEEAATGAPEHCDVQQGLHEAADVGGAGKGKQGHLAHTLPSSSAPDVAPQPPPPPPRTPSPSPAPIASAAPMPVTGGQRLKGSSNGVNCSGGGGGTGARARSATHSSWRSAHSSSAIARLESLESWVLSLQNDMDMSASSRKQQPESLSEGLATFGTPALATPPSARLAGGAPAQQLSKTNTRVRELERRMTVVEAAMGGARLQAHAGNLSEASSTTGDCGHAKTQTPLALCAKDASGGAAPSRQGTSARARAGSKARAARSIMLACDGEGRAARQEPAPGPRERERDEEVGRLRVLVEECQASVSAVLAENSDLREQLGRLKLRAVSSHSLDETETDAQDDDPKFQLQAQAPSCGQVCLKGSPPHIEVYTRLERLVADQMVEMDELRQGLGSVRVEVKELEDKARLWREEGLAGGVHEGGGGGESLIDHVLGGEHSRLTGGGLHELQTRMEQEQGEVQRLQEQIQHAQTHAQQQEELVRRLQEKVLQSQREHAVVRQDARDLRRDLGRALRGVHSHEARVSLLERASLAKPGDDALCGSSSASVSLLQSTQSPRDRLDQDQGQCGCSGYIGDGDRHEGCGDAGAQCDSEAGSASAELLGAEVCTIAQVDEEKTQLQLTAQVLKAEMLEIVGSVRGMIEQCGNDALKMEIRQEVLQQVEYDCAAHLNENIAPQLHALEEDLIQKIDAVAERVSSGLAGGLADGRRMSEQAHVAMRERAEAGQREVERRVGEVQREQQVLRQHVVEQEQEVQRIGRLAASVREELRSQVESIQTQLGSLACELSACVEETGSKDEALSLSLQRLVEQIFSYMESYSQTFVTHAQLHELAALSPSSLPATQPESSLEAEDEEDEEEDDAHRDGHEVDGWGATEPRDRARGKVKIESDVVVVPGGGGDGEDARAGAPQSPDMTRKSLPRSLLHSLRLGSAAGREGLHEGQDADVKELGRGAVEDVAKEMVLSSSPPARLFQADRGGLSAPLLCTKDKEAGTVSGGGVSRTEVEQPGEDGEEEDAGCVERDHHLVAGSELSGHDSEAASKQAMSSSDPSPDRLRMELAACQDQRDLEAENPEIVPSKHELKQRHEERLRQRVKQRMAPLTPFAAIRDS